MELRLILLVHEVIIRSLAMPWVEGVVADHGESLLREARLLLADVIEILDRNKN
jgi:hypothetical protein